MKHVGELAIIGVSLSATTVKPEAGLVPRKVTLISQSVGFFRWLFLHTYYRIVRVAKLQLNREW